MEEEKVNLQLTIAEANLILEALGTQPYVKVYQLVAMIQEQATAQLNQRVNGSAGEMALPATEDQA